MIKAIIFDVGGVLHINKMEYVEKDIKNTLNISNKVFRKAYNYLIPILQKGEISEPKFWGLFLGLTKTKARLPKRSFFLREYIKDSDLTIKF